MKNCSVKQFHHTNANQNHKERTALPKYNGMTRQKRIINVGKDTEKEKFLYTVGRNLNWYSHYGKQYGDF
jgi:hypothetical protein